jgi:hypothetical protein
VLLDVVWALTTEGMTLEQRDEFEQALARGGDQSLTDRRAYALTYGEMG